MYIIQQMALRDIFKKKDTKETTPEKTPEQLRKQGLINFAMENMHINRRRGTRPPGFSLMPEFLQELAGKDGGMRGWEAFQNVARGREFARTDFQHDGDWYANNISHIPAEYVGGKEGEMRYYGGAMSHPLRNQTRTLAQHRALTRPYYSVEDSIPAAEAHRLAEEWENR